MGNSYIAVDIGASGVKIISATLNGNNRVYVSSENTVPYRALALNGHLYINIYGLFDAIKNSIGSLSQNGTELASLGIDTFGNGYALFDEDMAMIGLPFFYKDHHTQGILAIAEKIVSMREIYQQTGVFPTDIRVLMQLHYEAITSSARLKNAKHLLLLPDILSYFFTGEVKAERSMVSVAHLLSAKTGNWCFDLMEKLSIPTGIFPPIIEGGRESEPLPLLPEVREELDCKDLRLAHIITHDTESALLAAPMLDESLLFASLGSSVICGVKTNAPLICEEGFQSGFKNMHGAFGSNSFCRDFTGLWLLEQCMETWRKASPAITYADIMAACTSAGNNNTYLDLRDPSIRFFKGSLVEAINQYCARTQQPIVISIGEMAKCVFESIALQIKWTHDHVKHLVDRADLCGVSVIGGGVRNQLLLQMIADALGLPVYAGSPYSSSIGNVLMQMYIARELGSIADVRQVASDSCAARTFTPSGTTVKWDEAMNRMEKFSIYEKRGNDGRKN